VVVDGCDALVAARGEHLVGHLLLAAQHHTVDAADANGGGGLLDGLVGVLHLEDAAVGGEGGHALVVAGAGRTHRGRREEEEGRRDGGRVDCSVQGSEQTAGAAVVWNVLRCVADRETVLL